MNLNMSDMKSIDSDSKKKPIPEMKIKRNNMESRRDKTSMKIAKNIKLHNLPQPPPHFINWLGDNPV